MNDAQLGGGHSSRDVRVEEENGLGCPALASRVVIARRFVDRLNLVNKRRFERVRILSL